MTNQLREQTSIFLLPMRYTVGEGRGCFDGYYTPYTQIICSQHSLRATGGTNSGITPFNNSVTEWINLLVQLRYKHQTHKSVTVDDDTQREKQGTAVGMRQKYGGPRGDWPVNTSRVPRAESHSRNIYRSHMHIHAENWKFTNFATRK